MVAIMRVLLAIKKAALALHRWFMKYSGMTMIIDNVEDRRRWRRDHEHVEVGAGSSCGERESPSREVEEDAFRRTVADGEPAAGPAEGVLGSTEEDKKVPG